MLTPVRIAQVAPPLEPVPPPRYGGTERVVASLVRELHRRGHVVTTFASGDSQVPGTLVRTVERALWPAGYRQDTSPYFVATIDRLLEQRGSFDVVHTHLEWYNPLLARLVDAPVVATFHGRLDLPYAAELLAGAPLHPVGISASQVRALPNLGWAGIVHNGLDLATMPFVKRRSDALCFVGRVAPEKGIVDAIEIALAAGRPLRIAAKVGSLPADVAYHESVFLPALRRAGSGIEYLGELGQAERDQLFAESYATLMPGGWPEPFGLVAIESLACGTPLVARPAGALPEIVTDGVDGFFGGTVAQLARLLERVVELDRRLVRRRVLDRFSAERMADGYERIYRDALEGARTSGSAAAFGDPLAMLDRGWRLPAGRPNVLTHLSQGDSGAPSGPRATG